MLAFANGNRRIVGVHDVGSKDMRTKNIGQRNQQRTHVSDPLRPDPRSAGTELEGACGWRPFALYSVARRIPRFDARKNFIAHEFSDEARVR